MTTIDKSHWWKAALHYNSGTHAIVALGMPYSTLNFHRGRFGLKRLGSLTQVESQTWACMMYLRMMSSWNVKQIGIMQPARFPYNQAQVVGGSIVWVFCRLKNPRSRKMSARSYALYSVCPQFSFLFSRITPVKTGQFLQVIQEWK